MEIQDALDHLESEPERIVLDAYYVSRMTMREISELIGYAVSHTYRLRSRGLQHLQIPKDDKHENY